MNQQAHHPSHRNAFRWMLFLVALFIGLAGHAEESEPKATPQTGIFATKFTERSPKSAPREIIKQAHWPPDKLVDYDIADHTFQLIVPNDYDPEQAYGLLVFIHPNNQISLNHFYGKRIQEILAKHNLIWVSYSDAGNPVMPNVRLGLALDAVHNVVKQYNIDRQRVYVSGMSGGGRMSCMAGVYYPRVFRGVIPIVGTLYFRNTDFIDDPKLNALLPQGKAPANSVWRRGLVPPKASVLREMRKSQRWALLAGEKDYNMPQMRSHFEHGLKKDKFEHAHYLEVPGMAHTYPEPAWFEKAIVLLDSALDEQAGEAQGPADARAQRQANKRLDVAIKVLDRDVERGKRLLQLLIEQMPNTDAAATAQQKLNELNQP